MDLSLFTAWSDHHLNPPPRLAEWLCGAMWDHALSHNTCSICRLMNADAEEEFTALNTPNAVLLLHFD